MDAHTESAPDPRFGIDGEVLCLDFSNTWEHRGQPEDDRLEDYSALLEFALESGSLDRSGADRLRRAAEEDPARAGEVFSRAVALRDAIYRVFSARAACRDLDPDDLEAINRELARGLGHRQLSLVGDAFEWEWAGAELDGPLWPVAWSAAELLTSDELSRVRECDAEDCHWLFLDQSRSRSRRWCSMQSCGNRAKARRHYRRATRK